MTVLDESLGQLQRDDVIARIWRGDHTLWSDDPTEITVPNRLGWLTVVDEMTQHVGELQRFAKEVRDDGMLTVVLLGMGGSSLAPEVLFSTFGAQNGGLELRVLDTTVPADILALERSIELDKTLFIVASKSGTTLETMSQFAYFWDKLPDGRHFIAITDPGTSLERLGRDRGFRHVFLNPESLGGRYSALSCFGLVPGALISLDLKAFLEGAAEMQQECTCVTPGENPGASLGAFLGAAALAGQDKLTLMLPPEVAALGDWIEQLTAESTGKEGRGIIPIVGEELGAPDVYGADRVFVGFGDQPGLKAIEEAGHPVLRLPFAGKHQLAAEFYRWQFATAVAGYFLHINAFDQPNVQQAKDAAARHLAGPSEMPASRSLAEQLQLIQPGDYIAILAYLPRTADNRARLQALRLKLRDRYHVATTVGFGPRYLHSTGQIHKGGPNSGVFFQLLDADAEDAAIPGQTYSFGRLKQAQADGDLESLLTAGRRAVRATLDNLEAV